MKPARLNPARSLLERLGRATTRPLRIDKWDPASLRAAVADRRVRPVIPLARCITNRCNAFAPGGDSPHQRAAAIYLETNSRDAMRAFLEDYLRAHRPRSLAEWLFGNNDPSLHPLTELHPLTRFQPWTERIKRPRFIGQAEVGTVDPVWLGTEIDRQISAIKALQRFGYRPHAYKRGFISGGFIVCDGDWRFHLRNGVHRLAVLSALGTEELSVQLAANRASVIDADEVDTWVHVRSGYCSREVALRIIRRYFGQG